MSTQHSDHEDFRILRQQAEEKIRIEDAAFSETLSPEQTRHLLHELSVSRIELEMQNEELRKAQMELEASRERYFDLYDMAPVGYLTLGEKGLIQEANFTAADLFGLPRNGLAGHALSRFILSEDQDIYYRHRKQLLETGEAQECELRMLRQDAAPFWARLETTLAQEEYGTALCRTILSDITRSKQAEVELRKLTEHLNQTQKLEALGVLVAGVAHNINNVLASIMAAASLYGLRAKRAEDQMGYGTINTICKRGRDVVKSLMQYARPTLADKQSVELHGLINEVCGLLNNVTMNRIIINRALSEGMLWVCGDAGNLSQAFMNLGLNALDAMPSGGTLTFRTAILEGNRVEVSIEDNGEGMSPEILSRALDPFFTTKEVGKGTGLGLSMTHGVIKAHSGTMEISSQPGLGTTVKIVLPRIAAPAQKETVQPKAAHLGHLKILLVDDEEDVRFLMSRMLQVEGLLVKCAAGGEEAIASIASGDIPDLIILDQNMPRMDGIETMERIREGHPDIPILISSGQPEIDTWPCFKQPKVCVIRKPFDLEEIRDTLENMSLQPQATSNR